MRIRPLVVLVVSAFLAIALTACGSSNKSLPSDPVAAVKLAARRSLATAAATVRGALTAQGRNEVVVLGSVEFKRRNSDVTLVPPTGARTSYPPYEERFVDGVSYIEIDSALRRPAALLPDTKWVAYQSTNGRLPVPGRVLPPDFPIKAIDMLGTSPIVAAHFLDPVGTNPRRVVVQFQDPVLAGSDYTYYIEKEELIVSVSVVNRSDKKGVTLVYLYNPAVASVVAPTEAVQRLDPHQNLYPNETTAPTA